MKCECTTEKLLHTISVVDKIVGKKESLPVLSCVFISTSKNTLTVKATNLETSAQISIPSTTEEEGNVAVSSSVLLQTLQTVRDKKLTLSISDGNLTITTQSSITTIKALSSEEFPKLPKPQTLPKETFQKATFIQGIQSVVYSASQSMIRPELASIYITKDNGVFTFVATDSFRLSEKKVQGAPKEGVFEELLIPYKNALEIVHILSLINTDEIAITVDEGQLYFVIDNNIISSRIIDGTFPNYQEIIPKSFSTEVTILKEEVASVFKKARIFSQKTQQISFHVYPQKKIFSITAQNTDTGEMSDSLDAAISGDDLDINFNLKYVSDCLQSIHSDSITFQFSGIGKPLVLKGTTDQSFLYLVMPLNR